MIVGVGVFEDLVEVVQQLGCFLEVGQCFSWEEFEQIFQEWNEFKVKVFLFKEELVYFQWELFIDYWVFSFLFEVMKVVVWKQWKKIKVKMLGILEEVESSDDEDGLWFLFFDDKGDYFLFLEFKIQSFFGLWYWGKVEFFEDEIDSFVFSKLGGEEEV